MHLGNIRNADLHRDLQMEMVTNEIGAFPPRQHRSDPAARQQ